MPFLGTCVSVLAFSRVLCAFHGIPKEVVGLFCHSQGNRECVPRLAVPRKLCASGRSNCAFGAWALGVWAFQGPGFFRSLAPGRLWLPGTWRWGRFGVAGMAA
jgi:hypothetical protein